MPSQQHKKAKSKQTADKMSRPIEGIYEQLGPIYNYIYGKVLFNEGRRVAIDLLEIKPKHRILEVGVGTGLTLPMYPVDCEVMGIDLSESMLREARILMERQHITNAEVRYMNANSLEFPDNHFDGVLGNLFISATSDPVGALEEMKRVCKPGGTLVLMNHFQSENPLVRNAEKLFLPLAKRLGFDSALNLNELLQAANLEVKAAKRVNILNLWTAVSMVNRKK